MNNQTKKYTLYALGEIILVMLGILLAFQVNNWNENRKIQVKEKVILQSLLDEFNSNKISLDGATERMTNRFINCKSLLQLISDSKKDFSKGEADSLMFSLKSFVSFDVSNGYTKGLLSTGDIRILQNDSLKFLITNWDKEVLDNATEIELVIKQELNNTITPYLTTHYSYASEGFKRNILYNTPFSFDHKSIFNNPEFENIVIQKIIRFSEGLSGYKNLNRFIEQIISITEREIEK